MPADHRRRTTWSIDDQEALARSVFGDFPLDSSTARSWRHMTAPARSARRQRSHATPWVRSAARRAVTG